MLLAGANPFQPYRYLTTLLMVNKIISGFVALVVTMSVSAQGIVLVNFTISQKESKTIFIGIDNKFKIEGFENLQKIEPERSIYFLRGDTLLLRPNVTGTLSITFHTKGGPQQVTFHTKVISDVSPAIGNYTTGDVVDKNEVIAQARVTMRPYKSDEIFFENYKVASFEAHVGKQVFSIVGERFTDELIAAIRQAKAGDKLILTSVKAINADVGKTIQSSSKFSFELK